MDLNVKSTSFCLCEAHFCTTGIHFQDLSDAHEASALEGDTAVSVPNVTKQLPFLKYNIHVNNEVKAKANKSTTPKTVLGGT